MTTVGILGAGKLGSVLARLAVAAGYRTLVAGSGDPGPVQFILDVMSPGATAASAAQAARSADLVILALPLGKRATIPARELDGKVVIDAMNYWPPTDGILAEFEGVGPSSAVIQQELPRARVVKTFSHLGYHQLEEDARPVGAPDRSALAIAGDDPHAVIQVAGFVDRIGFDPVLVGPLTEGVRFGPGSPAFGVSTDSRALEELLGTRVGADG
ncbi:NADP oxidoreductase [Enemella evansiae]|uniref:NADP oxidoreductase n=1 Tax=Enemella evansiae TaxID=2016499 RepID=A0A255G0R8_9ACTN|nr:NAD(P)-binding domain-containing protein [Enemella evansiae]OYO07966.1 NADP oxidoreductase [Enemella evansiae]